MSLLAEEKTSGSPSSGPTIIKWIVVVVLLCAVIVATLLGARVIKPLLAPAEVEDTSIPADAFTPSSILDGDLVLGVVVADPANVGKTGVKTAVYRVETGDGVEIPDVDISGSLTPFQLSFSKETTYAVFIGEDLDNDGTDIYKNAIDKAALNGSEALAAQLSQGTALPAPDSDDFLRVSPVINNSGFVLYASLPQSEANADTIASTSIEAWSIYLVNDENERTLITKGINPKWIDGSTFAFVQKDGVYVFDLDHKKSLRVWDAHESVLTAANGFAVSNEHGSFAISDTDLPLSIYVVGDWESPEVMLSAKGDAYASSIEFSADDEYVGAVVKRLSGEEIAFGIEYYSMEEQKFMTETLPMDAATIKGLYISDWQ
jgi:hypothetical protein